MQQELATVKTSLAQNTAQLHVVTDKVKEHDVQINYLEQDVYKFDIIIKGYKRNKMNDEAKCKVRHLLEKVLIFEVTY